MAIATNGEGGITELEEGEVHAMELAAEIVRA
jgi:hypothetical protein